MNNAPYANSAILLLAGAEFAFSIFDMEGEGKIDACQVGDVLRALNLNPTLALCEKMGATKKKGEKKLTIEEFLPIFGQVKKEKDQGCYEDFLECLKLYDKNENGMMLMVELQHNLLALGEYQREFETDRAKTNEESCILSGFR